MTGSENYHLQVRQIVVHHLCSNPLLFKQFLLSANTTMSQYISRSKMLQNGTWATQVEIFAMAHLLGTDIQIYTEYNTAKDGTKLFKWMNHSGKFVEQSFNTSDMCMYINHANGNHYNVVLSVTAKNNTKNLSKFKDRSTSVP